MAREGLTKCGSGLRRQAVNCKIAREGSTKSRFKIQSEVVNNEFAREGLTKLRFQVLLSRRQLSICTREVNKAEVQGSTVKPATVQLHKSG